MNPFLINSYIGPEYFCDREAETKTLIDNINNQSNTAFFAQRRLGKTALIYHVFYLLEKKKMSCIYLDIYATQSLQDFTNGLANAIYKVFPESQHTGKRFWEVIKLLRPVISMDEITGNPSLTLDITKPKQFEKTISHLLNFLDSQNKKIVIAIDEFQQVINYPEKNVEALLRTAIQPLKNLCFVFCGSNQKMMHHIFNSAKRPFYSSAKSINCQKINRDTYSDFIRNHFEKNKFNITHESIELILDISCLHTYYTQRLCHEVFFNTPGNINNDSVNHSLNRIMLENEGVYFQYRNLITSAQWNLLKGIALEEKVLQPYSGEFIKKHNLGTPANVKRTLDAMIEKELVYFNASIEEPYYEVQDKFFMRWLQKR